jgi:C4-dicarboxylate-specific signal transduction histidine kinase
MSTQVFNDELFEERYRSALTAYVARGSVAETQRIAALELGRLAIAQGYGLLDLLALHHASVSALREQLPRGGNLQRLLAGVNEFLTQVVAPYEMAYRGWHDLAESLRRANEELEARVAERTAAHHAAAARLHELQAELIHVSRVSELGQMVSALAHEVNQPLTAQANYLAAARRLLAAGNQTAAAQAIERITEQADRARQIIRRLRELVRKGETQRRVEDLSTTIKEAGALALIDIGQGLKMEIRVAVDATEAVIDKIQIQQVLLNLMRNAAEAMTGSPRRELSITTARTGNMTEISVADTGPGLPDHVRARLFQPFVTTKPTGMGVGLSVCRTIVEAHGGELRAEDVDGGGTVFRFTVPCPEPGA